MRHMLVALALLAGCERTTPVSSVGPAPVPSTSGLASASASAQVAAPPVAGGVSCGEGCAQFDSPRQAFLAAVAGDAAVVAIGEAHAPRGATATSAAKRFTEDLLPALAGRASDLLVELMMPPRGCADAAAEVREKQAPATSQQAPTNQNEYVAMGDRAHALGIVPDMLRPSCADMDGVNHAGDQAIEASLEMIARLTTVQTGKLIDRDAQSDADHGKTVVVYGGMLHNDLTPTPERAKWTYAPALDTKAGGRFIAVDLVVPEFILDDDTWRSFPWYARYDRARLGGRTTLLRTGPKSYVLVFPETRP
jgi:hypothetical protein